MSVVAFVKNIIPFFVPGNILHRGLERCSNTAKKETNDRSSYLFIEILLSIPSK